MGETQKRIKITKKHLRKAVAFLLVIALIVTSINTDFANNQVKAETKKTKVADESKKTTAKKTKKPEVVKEIKKERTENTNTYLMSDGSKKLEIYQDAIRYEEDGKLIEYDPSLENLEKADKEELKEILGEQAADKYSAVNAQGDSKQYFPKELNEENSIIMSKGKYVLLFAPVIEEESKQTEETFSYVPETAGDTITYTSENSDIKYEYISLKNGVKENIILKSEPESNEFIFKINSRKLLLEIEEPDGSISLLDKKSGKKVGYIMPPNITDGDGNVDYENIEYKIEEVNGEILLKLVVKEEYLKNANLRYPIKIDPTPVWFSDKLSTAVVNSMQYIADSNLHSEILAVENKCRTNMPYAGSEQRVYLDTSKVAEGECFVQGPGDISGQYIESAELCIKEDELLSMYGKGTVEIRKPEEAWDATTITWNNQPEMGEDVLGNFSTEGVSGTSHSIDLTEWAQAIAIGAEEDTGLVFVAKEEGTGATFKGPEVTHQGYMWLSITYRDTPRYDATLSMTAEYKSESDEIDVYLPEYYEEPVTTELEDTEADNSEGEEVDEDSAEGTETEEAAGVQPVEYKVYRRNTDENKFHFVSKCENPKDKISIPAEGIETADFRIMVAFGDGTAKFSDIVTLQKSEVEEEETTTTAENTQDSVETAEENSVEETITEGEMAISQTTITYDQITMDTDGDGLEDGYEIWDLKTKWNEKDDNGEYIVDTDGDDLPDGYEVFILGTDPNYDNDLDNNGNPVDSDGDDVVDAEEYKNGTHPWLTNTDFDEKDDATDTDKLKTHGRTEQATAAKAEVNVGLYDRKYSETEDGVTYTYITNIYRGDVKQIDIDYGDVSLNKTMKYFYDKDGNNIAIIEQPYMEKVVNGETKIVADTDQIICITYMYNADGNVTYICDQKTKYSMSYDSEGDMKNLKVGDQLLISYENPNEDEEASSGENTESAAETASQVSQSSGTTVEESYTTYGNGDRVKSVTTTYELDEDDTTSVETIVEIYYEDDTQASYRTEYNSEGDILKFTDLTLTDAVTYNYSYTDDAMTVTRSDGFTKTVKTETTGDEETGEGETDSAETDETDSSETETNPTTTTTTYSFKDIKGDSKTYVSSVATKESDSEEGGYLSVAKLYNNDTFDYTMDAEGKVVTGNLFSSLYNKYIIETTQTMGSNTETTYNIKADETNKNIKYTYDLAGNITKITVNNEVKYEYTYDAHGRLKREKDYTLGKCTTYYYHAEGNMDSKIVYSMEEDGTVNLTDKTQYDFTYGTGDWPDQLVEYGTEEITYDMSGNPENYLNGMHFDWSRGRQLSEITFGSDTENDKSDDKTVEYTYNESGLRTSKTVTDKSGTTDVVTEKTTYEWDESTLIRETVTDEVTDKTYEIWYFYDNAGNVIGYEYSYVNEQNEKVSTRIYYEKDLQGNVNALLDEEGKEIATYSYDAWGNITATTCAEGYETAYSLNHMTYRGYYRDNETGFYYLQSRYYDAEICRFINADDVDYLGVSGTIWGYDLYSYCENNPVMYTDPSGYAMINVVLAAVFAIVGWKFGHWFAYKITRKKNVKYWVIRGAVAVGCGAIGWLAGSTIARTVATYLKNNNYVVFKLADKLGVTTYYNAMRFLGINPFTIAIDSSKFIAIAKLFNTSSVTLGKDWVIALYNKAVSLGYSISVHAPHKGWSWHIHINGANGKLRDLHLQISKAAYDYLMKILK